MSHPLGTYSFLPWLRQGLANNITEADKDVNVKLRATAAVTLEIKGEGGPEPLSESIPRNVQLVGPGDIIGIDPRIIIKHEPHVRPNLTNFESNYLPYIEFYDEDFPWRYTPAAPNGNRLRPWITLVVLKEGEFKEAADLRDKGSPYITVPDAASKFPLPDQLWAWAHVHATQPLHDPISSPDGAAAATALQNLLNQNPDLAYSRVVCSRSLEPNTAYHAFLIPTFESGRLAGLGFDPADPAYQDKYFATLTAWETHAGYTPKEPENFPVYVRWNFRTGTIGSFEELVRLLQPKPVDVRVGTRDMDVQTPGSNLPAINTPADLGGFLKLGGALQVPQETLETKDLEYFKKYEEWDKAYPHPFQQALAQLLNLADDYAHATSATAHDGTENLDLTEFDNPDADPDPVITPPIYGRWHAKVDRLLYERKENPADELTPLADTNDWIHEANLDPRFRVPAGFGTKVVQQNQEEYMDAAWAQIGQVLETNRKIRQAQMAKAVASMWYELHLRPLLTARPEKALMLMAPVQQRIVTPVSGITAQNVTAVHDMSHATLRFAMQNSTVPPVLSSAPMRRIVRPGARLVKKLEFTPQARPDNLLTRVNEGEVLPAPPKTVPAAVPSLDDLATASTPSDIPAWLLPWLKKYPWLRYVPLAIGLLLLLIILLAGPAAAVLGVLTTLAVAMFGLFWLMLRWSRELSRSETVKEENMTPEAVGALPKSPDFHITLPGDTFQPSFGNTDSVQAIRFKNALVDVNTVLVASKEAGFVPAKVKLNLNAFTQTAFTAIDPEVTIPKRVRQGIFIPPHIAGQLDEKFDEVWGYPEFDIPMYKPLADLSDELFLPNLNLIQQNSITLLQTNRRFIEAYMLGLNHEFARELLWREYPTDQRGSSFRQFWDVKGLLKPGTPAMTDAQWKEILRDISPIHTWRDPLGENDRPTEGEKIRENIVLVIRGELLKKYPTAVITAQKAQWQLKDDGVTIDNQKERVLVTFASDAEEADPPRSKVKTPLFEAFIAPDIYFFGFDLTPLEARGGTGETQDDLDNPGWFFVIKERPGEPRFGFDVERKENPDDIYTWNDLAWTDLKVTNSHIDLSLGGPDDPNRKIKLKTPPAPNGLDDVLRNEQHDEDVHVRWQDGGYETDSADLAYILYQVPTMVAVHAGEMLPPPRE
ncbi:MAG TPA: hypothetical protein PLO67_10670 [Saprospiraceae bacterium]|nr:hypothetical protein [Saprospiraceae bacterium]HPI06587.1 hypothetical protein [Saprospiraceae bacterium]